MFKRGDIVKVENLPLSMKHFHTGLAIVVGSYRDQFGHGDDDVYTLQFGDGRQSSWYPADTLKMVESSPVDVDQLFKDRIAQLRSRTNGQME